MRSHLSSPLVIAATSSYLPSDLVHPGSKKPTTRRSPEVGEGVSRFRKISRRTHRRLEFCTFAWCPSRNRHSFPSPHHTSWTVYTSTMRTWHVGPIDHADSKQSSQMEVAEVVFGRIILRGEMISLHPSLGLLPRLLRLVEGCRDET